MESSDPTSISESDITDVIAITGRQRKKTAGLLDLTNINHFAQLDVSWRDDAACRNLDTIELHHFFHTSVNRKTIATISRIQELCGSCPVAANCLHEALMFNYEGYWAGFNRKQRNAYLRAERNNSVEDLTVAECRDILDNLRGTDSASRSVATSVTVRMARVAP